MIIDFFSIMASLNFFGLNNMLFYVSYRVFFLCLVSNLYFFFIKIVLEC